MSPKSLRRWSLPALLAITLAACGSDPLGVVVLSARAPGDQCKFDDASLYVSGGAVDFRPFGTGSFADSFYQVFGWQNNLTPIPIVVNGQIVDNGAGNNFIADLVTFNYQFSDPSQTFETEIANTRAVILAGATDTDNSVGVDLIQPKAAAKLAGLVNTTPQTLLVTFQLSGKVTAGNTLSTNKVSFPLTVYRSSTTVLNCPVGFQPSAECGFIGRNGTLTCVPSSP